MSKIQILPEDLINKIAAGEVVERPASVVKELVENSIDSGAKRIVVEIQDAGKKLIRVSDDGSGMTEGEIRLSLQRHSTSKISNYDDLFDIDTLGFRGEALPSIASVSKLKIEANPSGAGLTVEVKDLFHNTPARRKFLKSNFTETNHIGEFVSKYALAFPQIAFKFISDGKPLLVSPGTGKLAEAVVAVYGVELAGGLIEVKGDFPAGRIFGLASRPTLTRVDKSYETFFVNRRYIKNFLLNRALEEAYRTLIPGNRYPVGVIFVEIDPKKVDVNVHPTKREVKFANNQEVMAGVREAVKEGLERYVGSGEWGKGQEASLEVGSGMWERDTANQLPMSTIQTGILTQHPTSELHVTAIQPLVPIYQHKLTYIVATDGEELALIDQHAAHERIIFDQLNREPQVTSRQALLMPETVELGFKEAAGLRANLEYFTSAGFEIEEFGNNAFLLRAVPAAAGKAAPRQLLNDIIADLLELGKSVQPEKRNEQINKLIACHSAIKAGDKLTTEEINQLIKDLYSTQNPLTCPHGRPTMIRISEEELTRRFGR